jgi:hypothetical protein
VVPDELGLEDFSHPALPEPAKDAIPWASARHAIMMVPRCIFLLAVASCAPAPKHPIRVGVLIEGDRTAVGALEPRAIDGLELYSVELPDPAPVTVDDSAQLITRARAAYAAGDFDACRGELVKVDVMHLLVAANRSLASRAITLEAACAWGALARSEAKAAATRLASLGLELPETVVAPDVEQLIGTAIAQVGKAVRHPLAIRGEVGARLSIDGRPAGCTLPCTLDVADGDHVLAVETDGFMPTSRLVRTPETIPVTLAQEPASAQLAAQQWRARLGRGLPATDSVGVTLIAKLARDQRVAVLRAGTRLEGSIIVGGAVRAKAVRDHGQAPSLVRELAYDSGVLRRPAVWQKPWFWIAVSGGAIAIAGGIVALTYEPEVRTGLKI